MGVDIAEAALAAGHAVVATGCNTKAVAGAVGEADDVLVVKLDITSLVSAEAAVRAAIDHFGRIDGSMRTATSRRHSPSRSLEAGREHPLGPKRSGVVPEHRPGRDGRD
jgi:NAD(P)-dependent dehydrogenase (short-subunit alcohol dehydrogenase family)